MINPESITKFKNIFGNIQSQIHGCYPKLLIQNTLPDLGMHYGLVILKRFSFLNFFLI